MDGGIADLGSPYAVLLGVEDDSVLVTDTEAEVDVEDDVRSRKQLHREAAVRRDADNLVWKGWAQLTCGCGAPCR